MHNFIMVIGLPASGKSTFIEKLVNSDKKKEWVVLSSDKIREELYGNESVQGKPQEVFALMEKRLRYNLSQNKANIIYDATNILSKHRRHILSIVKQNKEYMRNAVIIGTTFEQCLKNNQDRANKGGRFVPPEVIDKMYHQYEPPHTFEGFNRIEVYYPFIKPYLHIEDTIKEAKKISHDCEPYHHYSIGTHMNRASKMAKMDIKKGKLDTLFFDEYADYYKSILPTILLFHDIGKIKTKTFFDKKGNVSEKAHYYCHSNIGAYDYMFYSKGTEYDATKDHFDYNIAAAIAYHMYPYQWKEEKTKEKYYKLWGFRFYNLIKAVNIYDLKSEEN